MFNEKLIFCSIYTQKFEKGGGGLMKS